MARFEPSAAGSTARLDEWRLRRATIVAAREALLQRRDAQRTVSSAQHDPGTAPAVMRPAAAGRRVLVVDDLDPLRRLIARQLTRVGHVVVGEAATVAEALARTATLAPDVVVLDFHLPDGLGTDVVARLTPRAPDGRRPAVVVCTGDPAAARAALA
ncbi:MAG TPA: response regulator, partial [Gemmatirosa sp.]